MSTWETAIEKAQDAWRSGTLRRAVRGKAASVAARRAQNAKLEWYRRRYPRVQWGANITIRGRLIINGPGRVIIGDRCYFDVATGRPNRIQALDPDATITIGDNCYLNGVDIAAQASVSIGRRAIIGEALILDSDYHSIEINRWDPQAIVKHRPVVIGENVWIGNKTVILKGVAIGDNSVVGAGTVVRGVVPANVVIAGNPHQIVKHLDTSIAPYEPDA